MRHRLFLFSDLNGEREIVVISDERYAVVCKEHADGRTLDASLDIVGNATLFPCDRVLNPKF